MSSKKTVTWVHEFKEPGRAWDTDTEFPRRSEAVSSVRYAREWCKPNKQRLVKVTTTTKRELVKV